LATLSRPSLHASPQLRVAVPRVHAETGPTLARISYHLLGVSRVGRAYLKDLQAIPALSRQEEWDIALRIEQGEQIMLEAVLEVPALQHEVRAILHAAADGLSRIEEVLEANPEDELAQARLRRLVAALDGADGQDAIAVLREARLDRKELERLAAKVPPDTHPDAVAKLSHGRRLAESAKRELVRRHLWLAVSIASRHASRGLDLLDRVQEGNLGLMRAADRFRMRKGFRFATYAAFWVRQGINRAAAEQGHCVRLPVQTLEAAYRAEQAQRLHDAKHAATASEQQVAAASAMSVDRLREVQQGVSDAVSLDASDREIGEPSPDAEQLLCMADRRRVVREQVASLEEREQRVLWLRFGLDTDEEVSRDEVAKVFCLTGERIRQLENQALQRLQHPSRAGLLRAV
jgi:RNA polymerase sigma factor (sigma-70 family)